MFRSFGIALNPVLTRTCKTPPEHQRNTGGTTGDRASILSGIKQMREVIPGILYHHERIDGKGYPKKLKGERIPLIGKIVGLAESLDAMTSKRTYRKAMTLEQARVEIEKEIGKQFDEKIARILLKSDMHHLWDVMKNGFTKTYGANSFAEYGTIEVGVLIK